MGGGSASLAFVITDRSDGAVFSWYPFDFSPQQSRGPRCDINNRDHKYCLHALGLGINSGTEVFLVPCPVLAALIFRKKGRPIMVCLSLLPLVVWYLLEQYPMTPLHRYDSAAARNLLTLNVSCIGVIVILFGWFQVDIYRRMEKHD